MIRKHAFATAIVLSALILFTVIRLPMALVTGFLPTTLRLAGCEGTLWHGRASALGLGGMVVQQNITWQLHPEALLRGRLAWEINGQFADQHSSLVLAVSPTTVELRQVNIAMPLEPLLVQDVKLKPLRLGGMVKLSAATFTPQHPSQLSVRVENLFSALIPAIGTLGSTEIHLTTQANQTAQWTANPIDGALAIHGEGSFNPNRGTASGKLAFKPDERLAGNLRPILALLQKGAGGEYLLNLPAS